MSISSRKLDREVQASLEANDIDAAAEGVLAAYGPAITGYLRVAVRDDGVAEQAFSAFSASVWQGLRRYRSEPGVRAWAYRLAYRAAKQHPRSAKTKHVASGKSRATRQRPASRLSSASAGPLALAGDAELLRQELSLEEQTLLTLRVDKQLTWGELGYVLGSASRDELSLRRRYERLLARLRRIAVTRGLIAPDARTRSEPKPRSTRRDA